MDLSCLGRTNLCALEHYMIENSFCFHSFVNNWLITACYQSVLCVCVRRGWGIDFMWWQFAFYLILCCELLRMYEVYNRNLYVLEAHSACLWKSCKSTTHVRIQASFFCGLMCLLNYLDFHVTYNSQHTGMQQSAGEVANDFIVPELTNIIKAVQ